MSEHIEYRELVPGLTHFMCQRLSACLSTKTCAERFARSINATFLNDERPKWFVSCIRCPIAAMHFHGGKQVAATTFTPANRDQSACARCGRSDLRLLIQSGVCVSCFNRNREHLRGRNARGSACVRYVEPKPWAVGVVGQDGKPAWVMLIGQSANESVVRAVRSGRRLHGDHPAKTVWNKRAQRFEYREGRKTLLALEIDGGLEFVAVDRLHDGETPATVSCPVVLMTPEEATIWLRLSGEDLQPDWRYTGFACSTCRQGLIQARSRADLIETRCTACP